MIELRELRPARIAPCAAVTVAALALLLAGCGSSAAPLSQPLDAGQSVGIGGERSLAQNSSDEHRLPQAAGNLLPNGLASPPPATTVPAAGAAQPPMRGNDDPGQPMSAEPMLETGGYDPSPVSDGDTEGASRSAVQTDGPHN